MRTTLPSGCGWTRKAQASALLCLDGAERALPNTVPDEPDEKIPEPTIEYVAMIADDATIDTDHHEWPLPCAIGSELGLAKSYGWGQRLWPDFSFTHLARLTVRHGGTKGVSYLLSIPAQPNAFGLKVGQFHGDTIFRSVRPILYVRPTTPSASDERITTTGESFWTGCGHNQRKRRNHEYLVPGSQGTRDLRTEGDPQERAAPPCMYPCHLRDTPLWV
jgi:hypothetical protein